MALPANPIALYWEASYGTQARITTLPTQFNIIFLFHATPSGTEGAITFVRGATSATLNADIATCRARGQRVIMTCGGAGAQININTQTRANNFIQSVKDINVLFGGSGTTMAIDGIDFNNFEQATDPNLATWMSYAGQQLKQYYGSDFLITAPPAATHYLGQAERDRLILATMYSNGALDWLCPQFYDGPGLNAESQIDIMLDYYNGAVTVNGSSVQIPRSVIGIGFGLDYSPTTWWTATNAANAYTDAVNDGNQPKGAFNFSANNNPTMSFATTVAPVITNNSNPPVDTPAFSLVASSQFTNGAATTAQLTAPSGKTSGADFQAGTINETSNPTAALNLASGKYTELEWCIKANTEAVNAQQYEFRVTYNGVSLDTYTVTPKWTIGTPVETPAGVGAQSTGFSSITGVSSITI